MTPRPREIPDAEILSATMQVMTRLSPARFTLAEVAKDAGVAPATLIQRFGTKRELLLAACRSGIEALDEQFAVARTKYRSPLKALLELMVECTSFAATPEAMANGLAYLQIDVTDPDFRALALEQSMRMQREVKKMLDEAVQERELVKCDTTKLARLLHAAYGGSMLSWAIRHKGTLAKWVRTDLEALLTPYRRRWARISAQPRARRA
jgi:AcrR family transcriptional regulator